MIQAKQQALLLGLLLLLPSRVACFHVKNR